MQKIMITYYAPKKEIPITFSVAVSETKYWSKLNLPENREGG